jgi:hypothetical protein
MAAVGAHPAQWPVGLSQAEPRGLGPSGFHPLAQDIGSPHRGHPVLRFSPKTARYAVAPAGALLTGLGLTNGLGCAPAHMPLCILES